MSTAPAGWHPDPRERHEVRYWDGSAWTDHVADGGRMSVDPVDDVPRFADVGGPAGAARPAGEAPWAEREEERAEDEGEEDERPRRRPPPRAPGEPAPGPPRDLVVVATVVAPGLGHLLVGPAAARRTLGLVLLSATILAVVISSISFGTFLLGLGIWLSAGAFALGDLRDALPEPRPAPGPAGRLMAVSGVALAGSLALPWYAVSIRGGPLSGTAGVATGLEALEGLDGVLLTLGAVGALAGVVVLAGARSLLAGAVAGVAGAAAAVLVAFRMAVDPLGGLGAGLEVSVGRGPGLLLAGAAALALAGAGVSLLRTGYGPR